MPVLLQPAWVLHTRPYRERSLLVDLLTETYGKIALVANGIRGHKRSATRAWLQPFTPLCISWSGKQSLYTLRHIEARQQAFTLQAHRLITGFYVNELIMYLLHRDDPCPSIYRLYSQLMAQLSQKQRCYQDKLRYFEKNLLLLMGYGLNFKYERNGQGATIYPQRHYTFDPEKGFLLCQWKNNALTFSGQSLQALDQETLDTPQALQEAKRLLRLVLDHHLQHKVIRSAALLH